MNSEQRGEDWFEDLYRAHHRAVVAYAVRRVGPDEADEKMKAPWRSMNAK